MDHTLLSTSEYEGQTDKTKMVGFRCVSHDRGERWGLCIAEKTI